VEAFIQGRERCQTLLAPPDLPKEPLYRSRHPPDAEGRRVLSRCSPELEAFLPPDVDRLWGVVAADGESQAVRSSQARLTVKHGQQQQPRRGRTNRGSSLQ